MSERKVRLIIEEIVRLCQSGIDFNIAFEQAKEFYGVR